MTIRRATEEDARAVAQLQTAAWKAAYSGLIPDRALEALTVDGREEMWRRGLSAPTWSNEMWLSADDGDIAGFIVIGPCDDGDTGIVRALYVHPSVWRNGQGSTLLRHGEQRLGERGFAEAHLWVLEGNEGACRFYGHHGWMDSGKRRDEQLTAEVAVCEARYIKRLVG